MVAVQLKTKLIVQSIELTTSTGFCVRNKMGFTTILPKPDWGTQFPNVDPSDWEDEDDD